MAPGIVIVVEVLGQDAMQMSFAQYNHMIQTFSTYRADHPFVIRILPGLMGSGGNFFDAHALHAFDEVVAADSVAITSVGETRASLSERPSSHPRSPSKRIILAPWWARRQMTQVLDSKGGQDY